MESDKVKIGLRVEIKMLGDTKGMIIAQKYLEVRKVGIKGTIVSWVPGHGGDVWWVRHDDGVIGAYGFDEFEPLN